jgi:MFS family permease
MLLAACIEAPLALLSDRLSRQRVLAFAQFGLSAALALCALARQPWLLSLGLGLAGAASGVACASAQGELISLHHGRSEQAMTRWVAFGAVGDILAPLASAVVSACGMTYRAAFGVLALLMACVALRGVRARAATPELAAAEDPEPREPLLVAARHPRLWLCLLCAAACTLLDEIVAGMAALRLERDLGASAAATAACLGALSVSSLCGALVTERLLEKLEAKWLLLASAAGSSAALTLMVLARDAAQMLPALSLLGFSAATQYPLAKAAAYDVVPGRPGLVNAAAQVFVVLEVGLPLAVGAIASRYGLEFALASLAVQPAFMVVLAWVWRGSGPRLR